MNLRELVAGLDDPQRSWQVQMALIQWGEEAVPPLVEFLLGPPALDPHPRRLAAGAIGAIGGEARPLGRSDSASRASHPFHGGDGT